MLKVCLLVLGSVSLLPLAAQAMEEGDGWLTRDKRIVPNRALPQTPTSRQASPHESEEKEGKGKEKETEKRKLEKQERGMHFSQVTGIVRQGYRVSQEKAPISRDKNKAQVTNRSNLRSILEEAQTENEGFLSRMDRLTFESSEIESILYPARNVKKAIPIQDLRVTAKVSDPILNKLKIATRPAYVEAFLQEREVNGEAVDTDLLNKVILKTHAETNPCVSPKVTAKFDGVVMGKYEGTTIQTINREQGGSVHDGKLLAFKLMIGDTDLMYPYVDDKDDTKMLSVKLVLNVMYREGNK